MQSKIKIKVKIRTKKLACSIAKLKAKLRFLSGGKSLDMIPSLRLRVGKRFDNNEREAQKNKLLEECRKKFVDMGIEEINSHIANKRQEIDCFFDQCERDMDPGMFKEVADFFKMEEKRSLCGFIKKHDRKIANEMNLKCSRNKSLHLPKPDTERRKRHSALKKERRKARDKRRKCQAKVIKKNALAEKVNHIKQSNLVRNFSNEDVPDEVFLYLSLGSSFIPSSKVKKHDVMYDTKQFCRKIAWAAFYHKAQMESNSSCMTPIPTQSDNAGNDQGRLWKIPEKLKLKSRNHPEVKDKLLEMVINDIMGKVENLNFNLKCKRNLTMAEVKGMQWCRNMVKEHKIYITKVDKGGCILILNADNVKDIVLETLNDGDKFTRLPCDPREEIKQDLKGMIKDFYSSGLLSQDVRFAITGQTEKGGTSHNHAFVLSLPYIYPLFKIHKLSESQIVDKIIPPTRMVTSGIGGPTYRLSIFLNSVLQPVAELYCKGELLKDTPDFMREIDKLNQGGRFTGNYIGTLDVDALYPNIRRDLAMVALRHAFEKASTYTPNEIEMLLTLVEFCLGNSIVHFRGQWFRSNDGVPTGNTDSGSIANIYVKWILDVVLLKDGSIAPLNRMRSRKRFLDDIWFVWLGSLRQFEVFKQTLNEKGKQYLFTLKGGVGKKVEFLDTYTVIGDGKIDTDAFFKPTDASCYLNRRSDHPPHTFSAIPFSQFRRMVVNCSDDTSKERAMSHIEKKLLNSDFCRNEIAKAKAKALKLNRNVILHGQNELNENGVSSPVREFVFVINHSNEIKKGIQEIVRSHTEALNSLIGNHKIIVAERRNMNTASMLFQKSAFSKEAPVLYENQRCGAKNCKCCQIMCVEPSITVNGFNLKLDFSLNCANLNCIYVAFCRYCNVDCGIYVGQSITKVNKRMNGHRCRFRYEDELYKKSALSHHIFEKHPEHFHLKLKNFKLGVVKATSAMNLDKLEDYYLTQTKADIYGLNRYKVMQ